MIRLELLISKGLRKTRDVPCLLWSLSYFPFEGVHKTQLLPSREQEGIYSKPNMGEPTIGGGHVPK